MNRTLLTLTLALVALISCTDSSRHAEMLRQLERAEEMNSAYVPMDTLKGVEEMTEYFMAHGSEEERIRANYMMGSVFRDRGDSPMALEYYLKAINQTDTTKADCNHELLSRIYAQMAQVFTMQSYPQKSIEMWENAKRMARKANDEQMFTECLSYTSRCYRMIGNKPMSVRTAREAQERFRKIGNAPYAAAISGELAAYYLEDDSLDEAKKEIDIYISDSKLYNNGEINPNCAAFLDYLGQYYEKTNRLDSALYFYRKLADYHDNVLYLVRSYRGQLSVYAKTHRTDSVAKYTRLYTAANDTANVRNSADEVSRVQSLYDYTAHKQRALQKTEENQTLWRIIFISVTAVIALVCTIWIYRMRQKQRQQALYQQIARLRQFEKLQKEQTEASIARQDNVREQLFLSEAYKLLRQHIAENKPLRDAEIAILDVTVNKICDAFKPILYSAHNLSEQEYAVCLLVKFELSTKEISALLCRSRSAITHARKRLFVKLFGREGSANELDEYILSL